MSVRSRRVALVLLLAVGLVVIDRPAAAQPSGRDVDVEVVAGFDGRIGHSTAVPARITLTSPQARTVDVEIQSEFDSKSYRVELVAGAPVELDVALFRPPMVIAALSSTVRVREVGGSPVGTARSEIAIEPDLTAVGVGPSLIDQLRNTPTVAGVQNALLVPLEGGGLLRPGALQAMSGVVLGAAELDALTEAERDRLRTWVWQGGNLAVDLPPDETLPVVDLPADPGGRTAVGAGWVRFTDGLAATGAWEQVIEPAVMVSTVGENPFVGDVWFEQGRDWGWLGLVDVRYLPTIVVVAAVFGTALVVGPVLWALLRSRGRRRWMWIASPALSLCVAAGLLVIGQGIFTRAETRAAGTVSVDAWSSTGDVLMGLKASQDLDLAADVDVIVAAPPAVVSDIGDGRAARLQVPRNGFGYIGLGGVTLDSSPQLSVKATAIDDDRVEVTVTNRSDSTLRSVHVRAAGRSRPFKDVPAGESVSLPFIVGSEIDVFSSVFPRSEFSFDNLADAVASQRPQTLPLSRGLVLVSGVMQQGVSVGGLTSPRAELAVHAVAPITSESESPSAVRIEMVGSPPLNPDVVPVVDFGSAPTTLAVPPDRDGGGPLQPVQFYARLSAAAGRSAAPCAVHTSVHTVSWWDGSDWVPAEPVGEHFNSDRFVGANEVQRWALPEVAPGSELYLRLDGNMFLVAPQLFDCAAP